MNEGSGLEVVSDWLVPHFQSGEAPQIFVTEARNFLNHGGKCHKN